MRELVGGCCECSRLRETLVDELRVVEDASSSVFEEPPPPRTAVNPSGPMPSINPALSFPPENRKYFILPSITVMVQKRILNLHDF